MNEALKKLIKDSFNVHTGMAADYEKSQYAVWKNKKVYDSRLLFACDRLDHIEHEMTGAIEISDRVLYNGHPTLHMFGDNREQLQLDRQSFTDWPGCSNIVHFKTHGADLSEYSRITLWIYADAPTRPNTWLYFVMCNKDALSSDRQGLDSRTGFNVPSNQWYPVFWEFTSHERDQVREFVLVHEAEGVMAGDDPEYHIYIGDMKVEKVDADVVEGWALGNRIAYSQIGFLPDAPKQAVTQNAEGAEFVLYDTVSGELIYTGQAQTIHMDIGTYQVMDFSAVQRPGKYILKIRDRMTYPFPIDWDVLYSPIWKNINFFQRERCGGHVPGLHGPCGMTDFIVHPDGRKINNSGGWHDAGDLCQELCTTCDGITAMLDLITNLNEGEKELKARVEEEVRHGLDWVLKTSFHDGYYAFESGHMQWDDFILKEDKEAWKDDLHRAATDALGHWFRAGTLAQAYLVFRDTDERYARWCLKDAIEDFEFGQKYEPDHAHLELRKGNTAYHELQHLSRKGYGAVMLFKATGNEKYSDIAAQTAAAVIRCQQQENTDWDIPLKGFFYCEQNKRTIAQYEHQSAEQAPILFLARLLEAAPSHKDAKSWEQACMLYAEYLKKTVKYIQPFGLLPAAVYHVDTKAFDRMLGMEGEGFVKKLYRDSICNGIRLSEDYYLRRMPVSSSLLRGFFAPVFAKAAACAEIGRIFKDKELRNIALDQVAWMLGKNPFARSDMYGEGYGFQPLYTPYSPDMTGAIPVGIQSKGANDAPFLPSDNRPTFNEVWIHSSARFLAAAAGLVSWIK